MSEADRLRDALVACIGDLRDFAQTNHQAHHDSHSGTWLTCDRGVCPGVKRALSRAQEAARQHQGGQGAGEAVGR